MLVAVKEIKFLDRQNKKRIKKVMVLKCDQCNQAFERRYHIREAKGLNFCSKACKHLSLKLGGRMREKTSLTNLEKWGTEYPQQLQEVKDKIRATNIEKYGGAAPSCCNLIKAKVKKTTLERHGIDCFLRDANVKVAGMRKKYGVDWPMQSDVVREKSKATLREKYGVEHSSYIPAVIQKRRETFLKKYGFDHPMKSEEVKQKFDFRDIARKAHATKKKNGTYAAQSSKVEDRFYSFLVENVDSNIERCELVNELWAIDFYIKTLDIHIQFDGVYWHGLDRSIEEIKEFKSLRDKVILKTMDRDKAQNKWFKDREKKLFRISGVEFKTLSKEEILAIIEDFCCGDQLVRLCDPLYLKNKEKNRKNGIL